MIINQIPLSDFNESVYLTAYIQTREPNRFEPESHKPAILICPSGAYMGIDDAEAEYLLCQFLAAGFQTFVLNYSIGAPYARFPLPIYDLEKAIQHIVENVSSYRIAKGKIAVCGVSSGAHLASIMSSRFNASILAFPILDLSIIDAYGRQTNESTKAMVEMMFSTILGSQTPSINMLTHYSSKHYVTSQTPATLIVHTLSDDWNTAAQVKTYETICSEKGVDVTIVTTANGDHGDYTGLWVHEAILWLKNRFEL